MQYDKSFSTKSYSLTRCKELFKTRKPVKYHWVNDKKNFITLNYSINNLKKK